MKKILEFLKRSDFINKSYAENIYQVKEFKRYKAFGNKIKGNQILLIALFSIMFNSVALEVSGVNEKTAPLSIFFYGLFLYIVFIVVKKIYIYLDEKNERELKREKSVIDKMVYFDFLSDIESIFGYEPSREILLTINLIAKEPFLTDNDKIDKIQSLIASDKKLNLLETIDTVQKSSARDTAIRSVDDIRHKSDSVTTKKAPAKTTAKTAVKKAPVKTSAKPTVKKAPANTSAKPTVKKAPAKTSAKTAVKKAPAKTAAKPAVKKAPVKTAAKPAAKKAPVKTAAKPAAKKAPAKD